VKRRHPQECGDISEEEDPVCGHLAAVLNSLTLLARQKIKACVVDVD